MGAGIENLKDFSWRFPEGVSDECEENKTVSVVIRTVDGREKFIKTALFSLYCSIYPHIEAIIVYQGLSPETFENLKGLRCLFPELQIQVCQNPTQVDSRSENINLGFEKAKGRYLGILDDDDAVFPEHYAVLVNALEKTENAWAYAQTVIHYLDDGYLKARDIRYGTSEYSYPKLWVDNFIPIHCFLLDRCRIQVPGLLRFNGAIQRIEDYEFLLRLGAHYNPAHWNQITSLYNIALDGSNSNYNLVDASQVIAPQESEAGKTQANHQAWEKARFVVQGLKRKLWFQHAAKLAPK